MLCQIFVFDPLNLKYFSHIHVHIFEGSLTGTCCKMLSVASFLKITNTHNYLGLLQTEAAASCPTAS